MYKNKQRGGGVGVIISEELVVMWAFGPGCPDVKKKKSMRSSQEERGTILHHCHPHLCQRHSLVYMTQNKMSRWDTDMSTDFKIGVYVRAGMITDKEKHFSFKRSLWQQTSSTFRERSWWRPLESFFSAPTNLRLSLHKSVVCVNTKSKRISLVGFYIDIDTSL